MAAHKKQAKKAASKIYSHAKSHRQNPPVVFDESSDSESSGSESGDLRSPSPELLCPFSGQRKLQQAMKHKRAARSSEANIREQDLSPLSKFRNSFLYTPKPTQIPHRHAQHATIESDVSSEDEIESDCEPRTPPTVHKKKKPQTSAKQKAPRPQAQSESRPKQKAKRGRKPKAKKVTVEDEDQDTDELAIDRRVIGKKAKPSKPDAKLRALLENLEKANTELLSIGDPNDVAEYLEGQGTNDDEGIKLLRQICSSITTQLGFGVSRKEVPTTIGHYNQFLVYREKSNIIMLLRPVEVFHGNERYSRRKVLGVLCLPGSSYPLMCALPGYDTCTDHHPGLLGNETWLEAVKQWAEISRYKFRKYQWDLIHNREPGDAYASHVEPKLMLWFACSLLKKYWKRDIEIPEAVNNLHRLKYLLKEKGMKPEAEIIVSRLPCTDCRRFQAEFEDYTTIKFKVVGCKNLGQVYEEKNTIRQITFPLYARDPEPAQPRRTSTLQVVLPAAPQSQSLQVSAKTKVSSTTVTQKTKLLRHVEIEEWHESDYNPSNPDPFSAQARKTAKSMKAKSKKRNRDEAEVYPSLVSPKKQKNRHKHKHN